MRTVVLVGAGATLAEALPDRPLRDQLPPLDSTFFDLCRVANLRGRETVQDYMEEHFGIDPFAGGHTMEEVFNFLYSDVFADSPPDDAFDAYWALVRMYTAAIARTTNRLKGTSRKGVGAILRSLWRRDQPDVTFVTFNQDLVIENAVEEAKLTSSYSQIPWDFQSCYELEFGSFLYSANEPTFLPRDERSLRVLKLHGSLNWFYKARSSEDAKNSIRAPKGQIHCLANRRVLSGLRTQSGRKLVHLLPLVVPPIYEKGPLYRRQIGGIWTKAREALERAQELVVFGYSFPDADYGARSLLRGAFHQNTEIESVTVVDVSSSVASRVADLLDVEAVHFYRDAAAFARDQ